MKKFYVLVLAILSAEATWSQKIWDGPNSGGNWTTAANWSDNTLPVAGDVVQFGVGVSGTINSVPNMSIAGLIISGGANVTLAKPAAGGSNTLTITNGAAATDFQVATGSTLTLGNEINITTSAGAGGSIVGQFNTGANTFTTNGATTVMSGGIINNAGTVTSAAITNLIFETGATYIHARNGGAIPTANWNDGSITRITGITSTVPTGLSQSFGDFEWNSSQTSDLNLNGALQTIKGTFKVAKTSANGTARLLNLTSATNYSLNIGGDLNIESTAPGTTNIYFVNDGDGDATINVTGNYIHESGNLSFVDVNTNGNDGTAVLNLEGNLTQSGGDIDFTSGDNGPTGQKGSMNIKGNLSQTGGTIRTTIIDPDVVNGLITFNKTGVQTFTVDDPENVSYTNFVVANGSTLELNSDLGINRDIEPNWIGKFTVNSGGTLDASTFEIRSQIITDNFPPGDIPSAVANFTLLAGGKLITANPTGVEGSINTADNLEASLSSEADYEFQGASTGVFTTTPTANTLGDFIVNRSGGNLTLAMPLTITGELNLVDGLLNTTSTNLLTIASGATTTPATTTSFVNGPLAKAGTTAFTFPIGKDGAGFRNIGITAPSSSSTFRAEFFRDDPGNATLEAPLVRVSSCEYWDLTRTAGSGAARVVLSWEAGSACGGGYVTDLTTLRVAHLVGGSWLDEGRLSTTGDNSAGTITSGDIVSTFSPFALGSSSASNPLPVVFADVKAYEKDNGVQIEWSNLTEKDVAVYSIERSANGTDFTAIAQQLPASNQNDRANYTAFDASPGAGTNFYRIKAEETTGKIVYSAILSVNLDRSGESLRLYPNPVINSQVTITLSNIKRGLYTVRVVNTTGQDVFRQIISSQGQTLTQQLRLPSVKPGTYHMVITGDGYRENKKFIIQ